MKKSHYTKPLLIVEQLNKREIYLVSSPYGETKDEWHLADGEIF